METRYHKIEKLCLCLFFTCTKLRHMLMAPVLKGRLGKWMSALSKFDIRYQPMKAVKG
jgi:hypothetical protein